MNHFTEMRCLQDYLQYLRLKKQYEELKEGALETLNKAKEDYVLQELHKCEQHIKATEERSKWGWSPLYLLLKQHPLPSGPQCPWVHTKEELQDIITELEKESEPFSLENECPHIVRAFKLFCRSSFGRLHPLAHPHHGLTDHTILHYCHEQGHSVRLAIAVQDVIDYGFLWFLKMQDNNEVDKCQQDLLGLLGFDLGLQNPAIEKIWAFMSKVAHRAISDIHNLGMTKELEDMWCSSIASADNKPRLELV